MIRIACSRRSLVLALTLISAVGCTSETSDDLPEKAAVESTAPGSLRQPGYLPKAARALLREKMRRHAENTGQMVKAVVTLQYDEVERHARRLLAEPTLARPLNGDATMLNALLPERLFELQDALTAATETLQQAASRRDSSALSAAFSNVSQACVSCHAVYLQGRQAADPPAGGGETSGVEANSGKQDTGAPPAGNADSR